MAGDLRSECAKHSPEALRAEKQGRTLNDGF